MRHTQNQSNILFRKRLPHHFVETVNSHTSVNAKRLPKKNRNEFVAKHLFAAARCRATVPPCENPKTCMRQRGHPPFVLSDSLSTADRKLLNVAARLASLWVAAAPVDVPCTASQTLSRWLSTTLSSINLSWCGMNGVNAVTYLSI